MDKKDLKKGFTSLKLVSEIESEMNKKFQDKKADIGIFTEKDAKRVYETNEPITIKSTKNGIPDKVLTVDKAKKMLLNRQQTQSKRIQKTMEVVGDVLNANNTKLHAEFILDDAGYGLISRKRALSPDGIVTLNIEQDKIRPSYRSQ